MISIILPAYNAEKYISQTIESIQGQFNMAWELIIIDDGSTDDTYRICMQYCNDARIKLLKQKNAGPCAARNLGLQMAIGEHIAFVDADDFLDPMAYRKAIEMMDEYDADCAAFGYAKTDENGRVRSGHLAPMADGAHEGSEIIKEIVMPLLEDRLRKDVREGMVWKYIFNAKTIRDRGLRFSDEKYLEDELFVLRYFVYPARIVCLNEPMYYYRLNSGSVTKKYFTDFEKTFISVMAEKEKLIRDFNIPVHGYWKDNCAWAGLLTAVGNEFAYGNEANLRTHAKNLEALCGVEIFRHAIDNYKPRDMNAKKSVVAFLIRHECFGLLSLLYIIKSGTIFRKKETTHD